jgi:radical SAM protein with 4Fe4S-binding SPASM domain
VTYACNHKCPYCSCPWQDLRGEYPIGTRFSADAWLNVIASLVTKGVNNFILTGGEPTLLPEFGRLTAALTTHTTSQVFLITPEGRHTRQYPVSFVILTNGDTEMWTRSYCKSLSGTRCRIHVHLTGPPEVHEAMTGGNYARTIRTVQFAIDAGLDLVINLPLFRGNLAVAGKTVREALAMGVSHVNLMRVLPVGNARDCPDILLSPTAFFHAFQEITATCQQQNATCGVGSLVPSCTLPANSFDHLSEASIPHLCGCGTRSFCIDPSGFIRPCTCAPVIGGTIPHIEDALASDIFQSFRQRRHPPTCTGCLVQENCSGGCPAVWYGRQDFQMGDPWVTTPFQGGPVQ